jgi:hypothetical protein
MEDSQGRLTILRDMLTLILTYHQVMPVYLDFLFTQGLSHGSFREQRRISSALNGLQILELGRSGQQYQLCYTLSRMVLISGAQSPKQSWGIQQARLHHQFDVQTGATLWIVTSESNDLQEHIEELSSNSGIPDSIRFGTFEESFRSSLSAHLVTCQWSTEDWREYVEQLGTVVKKEVSLT